MLLFGCERSAGNDGSGSCYLDSISDGQVRVEDLRERLADTLVSVAAQLLR